MKVKEIERTGNIAWSPAGQHPIYVAAGTAAQQLDATFSTSAALDIYKLDLSDPGLEMEQVGCIPSENRFHKLAWGAYGLDGPTSPSGVLIGGADNGNLFVWNPDAIIRKADPVLYHLTKHTGAVAALDVNPYQPNLLASGASDSEIFIWDLNNTAKPMTPGAKSQPPDDVTCLAWNYQVQHILASTYAGRCVVWDLRKNEPIIKVSDSMSRIKCKLVAWHPEVATQMCLASEDDHSPVIQLWDLRFATSPLKVLESHTRGVLSMAWCRQDPDLLLSCGKDNRILCWNPNTAGQSGEDVDRDLCLDSMLCLQKSDSVTVTDVVYELPTSNQWSFDVQWCPRNPAIISSCAFDGHISFYSLMGGGKSAQSSQTSQKIADSFPTDPFSQAPVQQNAEEPAPAMPLKKPPKWLRRPVGASFGFGGKLVSFQLEKAAHPQQPVARTLHISQVVTETELVARSDQLQHALANNQFGEFCNMKVANSASDVEETIWNFLKVPFESDPRTRYLQLLGYDQHDLAKKVAEMTGSDVNGRNETGGIDADELAQKMAQLNGDSVTQNSISQISSSGQASPYIHDHQTPGDGAAAFDQIATQDLSTDSRPDSPLPISTSDDMEGLVTQALLTANFEAAVEVCLHHDRLAEAVVLAIAGGPELLARTQKKVFAASKSSLNRLISSVVTKDFDHVVRTCDLDSWKEALALSLTYCRGQQFSTLCDILGQRLETERDGELAVNACLCYICAGNVDRLVTCWERIANCSMSPLGLQDLVEKVMILRHAVDTAAGQTTATTPELAEKLSHYSELLAAQGNITTALNYLGSSNEMPLAVLRDRLTSALGMAGGARPFNVINVQPVVPPKPAVPAGAPAATPATRQRTASGPYQTQANGNFGTTTTPTSMYQHNLYGQPAVQPQPSYPTTNTTKNPLSQKYGVHNQPAINNPVTSTYNPYQPQQPYSNAGYPGQYDPTVYQPPATSQPNIYNPAVSQANPEFMRNVTPPLGSRRSSRHLDAEGISGCLMETMADTPSPPSVRRHSIFNTEVEARATNSQTAPYVPPTGNPTSYQDMRPTSAWNDPPVITAKKKEPKSFEPQAPITQPLYGVAQDPTVPAVPSYGGTQLYNPTQYSAQPVQVHQHPNQPQPHQQQQQPNPQAAPEPPKPVPKGPIPAEHQVLHDVLDRLTNMCINATTHPQTKRKLEDVLRKLETLYDKLRANTLSPNVTMGLHQIVQSIQGYDYQTGLAFHTQLISQGNFSEISSFMPGIKVLMQTALQLQVYLQ